MPTAQALRDLIAHYAETVTSRDVDAYVALFTEDAVQGDPVGDAPKLGHDGIRAFFGSAVEASEATVFQATDVHTSGDHVAFHFTITITLEGGTMVMSGIETFHVADDGRIAEVRAYWDQDDVAFG